MNRSRVAIQPGVELIFSLAVTGLAAVPVAASGRPDHSANLSECSLTRKGAGVSVDPGSGAGAQNGCGI